MPDGGGSGSKMILDCIEHALELLAGGPDMWPPLIYRLTEHHTCEARSHGEVFDYKAEPCDTIIVGEDTFKNVPLREIEGLSGFGGMQILESDLLEAGEMMPVNSRRFQINPRPIFVNPGESVSRSAFLSAGWGW